MSRDLCFNAVETCKMQRRQIEKSLCDAISFYLFVLSSILSEMVFSVHLKCNSKPLMQEEIDYSFFIVAVVIWFLLFSFCGSLATRLPLNCAFINNAKNGMCFTKICLVTRFIQFNTRATSKYPTSTCRRHETKREKKKKRQPSQ